MNNTEAEEQCESLQREEYEVLEVSLWLIL